MMIVNDDSRVVNKLETLLTDNARVIIYDHHIITAQATVVNVMKNFFSFVTKAVFTLARFVREIARDFAWRYRFPYLPWPRDINRNNPICVASPKVAKASTVLCRRHCHCRCR